MKSGKPIDISKSSLVSLKAELTRKQEEVRLAKSEGPYIKLPPKPKAVQKTNPGVEERNKQDLELLPEEVDLLKKSKEVLQVKSKLYDELQKGNLVSDDGKNRYLVDFDQKEQPSTSGTKEKSEDDTSEHSTDEYDEFDDNEWVEYTDCLGRTRKCHRSELAEMKEIDRKMAKEVSREKSGEEDRSPAERPPELVCSDMEREMFRKKWEEQERELLNKKDIHYEDVLFDEARAHGVGYFKFSRDEEERRREQEMLKKVREETEARQKEARLLRERRETQRQARLIAARQRQRARQGLPQLSEAEILEEIKPSAEESKPEIEEPVATPGPSTVDQLETTLKKAAHVRPWDIGKGPDQQPAMSQEEWIEKQRGERKDEFAPSYDSITVVPFDPSRPPPKIKKMKMTKKPEVPGTESEDAIEAGLRFIREQVEKGNQFDKK